MDYTQQPRLFQLRKVARYVHMYGLERTRIKVLGQLHMKRRFTTLPPTGELTPKHRVAIVGCGNYAYSNIAFYLNKEFGKVIGGCMDIDLHRAASMSRQWNIPLYTDDIEEILSEDRFGLVYIASNHASHAEYAIQALARGKDVYIEKPHVVTEDQLDRLVHAMQSSDRRIFLGFNRPGSDFGRIILERLALEPGPGLYNWFIAGHAIDPDHWYFRPEEGGRVLGNLCHWTDFVLRLAEPHAFPVLITPTRGRKSDVDIVVTYRFPDESLAVISFSAKGHTFEGVQERLSAHRGNCLISMDDYKRLVIDVVEKKQRYSSWHRDHGHRRNITTAYRTVFGSDDAAYDRTRQVEYVANTAWLFLKTREALELNEPLLVRPYFERDGHERSGNVMADDVVADDSGVASQSL